MCKKKNLYYRNDLKAKKTQIVQEYDSEMMEKYRRVKELNSKIIKTDENMCQLQVSWMNFVYNMLIYTLVLYMFLLLKKLLLSC